MVCHVDTGVMQLVVSESNYWRATRSHAPRTVPLPESVRADVVVIGAGILGCTAALRLAECGASVVILEASEIGSGASGRSGGFVVPNFAKVDPCDVVAALGVDQGERLLNLIGGAANRVFGLVREHAISCDAEQAGWIQPAHTELPPRSSSNGRSNGSGAASGSAYSTATRPPNSPAAKDMLLPGLILKAAQPPAQLC